MSGAVWHRLEFTSRGKGLSGGLEARVADPLWMLSRQSQMAEFKGDDAAQPAAVRLRVRHVQLTSLGAPSHAPRPLPHNRPLETAIESSPVADAGAAGLHARARASRRLFRMLTAKALAEVIQPLRQAYALAVPSSLVTFRSEGVRAAELLARTGIDSAALARASVPDVVKAVGASLTPEKRKQLRTVLDQWRAWYAVRDGGGSDVAWDNERAEYRFSMTAGNPSATAANMLELSAPEHDGTHLDWYTFDLRAAKGRPSFAERTVTMLPASVRYSGMPASRWWEFEDGSVNFGGIDAGPADLARLLVAEFASGYGDDWFVVPVTVPVGSLSEIPLLEVIDNFGGRPTISSAALADARRAASRAWRLFELTGDEVSRSHPSPWLLVAPTLAGEMDGPMVERVVLARDENANLAWAIERFVEGPLGRAVDRADAWHAVHTTPPAPVNRASPLGAKPSTDAASDAWRYLLETTTPPWWIPLVPERLSEGTSEVRLRRARMQLWDVLLGSGAGASQVGPQGVLLDPRHPRWFYEEEIQRGGVRVERRWQFGRWHDGSFHVWLQRRKLAGSGERSSGLRWDLLERPRPVSAG